LSDRAKEAIKSYLDKRKDMDEAMFVQIFKEKKSTKNGGKGIELTISSLTAVVDTADTNEKSAVYTFFSGKLFSAFSTAMKEIRKKCILFCLFFFVFPYSKTIW
jgi:hypothetical protein